MSQVGKNILISSYSGSNLLQGQHISLTNQIQQFTDTYQQFVLTMGQDVAADLISKSVLYLSIGVNDYIHYYLRNVSNVQNRYLPWGFSKFLASGMREAIKVTPVCSFYLFVDCLRNFFNFCNC